MDGSHINGPAEAPGKYVFVCGFFSKIQITNATLIFENQMGFSSSGSIPSKNHGMPSRI
jgi:hypothetical protein